MVYSCQMKQMFKSVYFTDHPGALARQRHIKFAFGPSDKELYESVRSLSGQEIRELLGLDSYEALRAHAAAKGCTVNAHSLQLLREQLALNLRYGAQNGNGAANGSETVGPQALPFDAIQATFKGGENEPLHCWYPLLEGYSPQFVEHILNEYAPSAERILDPFSGTGTTPLTASRRGCLAYYAEVNPLLQFLTAAKIRALSVAPGRRRTASERMKALADDWPGELRKVPPSVTLAQTYAATFGRSRFFSDETFDLVLRSRTFLDNLTCQDPFLASLARVAVLASLIPGSLLTRAGDLRYKTPGELAAEPPDFQASVQAQLSLMSSDLMRIGYTWLTAPPRLIAEDAKAIRKIPPLKIDAVVTSPPYLNGTNYFRNTKLELWFLDCLQSPDDLAEFRTRAVPAGINDVSNRRVLSATDSAVGDVVRELSRNAYDPRIPKMVQSYFQDMTLIIDGIVPHLTSQATFAIDIGDSVYGGVHVPTDDLLLQLLNKRGLRLEDRVVLRRRMSRSGGILHQVLLILRKDGSAPAAQRPPEPWRSRWESFKDLLPHQHMPYSKRNWGHPLHSLCSFQGKMKPSLAAHLVETFVPEGGSVLDPFAGVATIPFEAALSGRRAFAFDISPAAVVIGAAKLGRATWSDSEPILSELGEALRESQVTPDELSETHALGFNRKIRDYFHPATLREVIIGRRYFRLNPPSDPSAALVMASLLHILHGNRPYALSRRSHPITPFVPTGEFEYRPLMPRLTAKVVRSLRAGYSNSFVSGEMLFQDATSWWPSHIQNLDAIITSPPFFDSTRFYMANWMRLWFSGWSAEDFRAKPLLFVDERQKEDFRTYESVFRQSRERLKPGGVLVLHLGRSRKCNMADELTRISAPWFRVVDRFTESVEHCESHGIRDKGTVDGHEYLVLR